MLTWYNGVMLDVFVKRNIVIKKLDGSFSAFSTKKYEESSYLCVFRNHLSKSPLLITNASMTAIAAYNLFSASSNTKEFSL